MRWSPAPLQYVDAHDHDHSSAAPRAAAPPRLSVSETPSAHALNTCMHRQIMRVHAHTRCGDAQDAACARHASIGPPRPTSRVKGPSRRRQCDTWAVTVAKARLTSPSCALPPACVQVATVTEKLGPRPAPAGSPTPPPSCRPGRVKQSCAGLRGGGGGGVHQVSAAPRSLGHRGCRRRLGSHLGLQRRRVRLAPLHRIALLALGLGQLGLRGGGHSGARAGLSVEAALSTTHRRTTHKRVAVWCAGPFSSSSPVRRTRSLVLTCFLAAFSRAASRWLPRAIS